EASSIRLLRMIMPSVAIGMVWLHSKLSHNTLRIASDHGIVVSGGFAPAYLAEVDRLHCMLSKIFRRYGAWMLPRSFTLAPPGADSHYAGTIPMRQKPNLCEADT